MSEEKIRKVFSKNLKHYLEAHEKQPVDIVRDLKIPFSTVSSWMNALKMPRMGNVELLAKYLHVEKSDLLEEKNSTSEEIVLKITEQEIELIRAFYKLNSDGRREAIKRIMELSEIPRYAQDTQLSENTAM